MLNIHIIKTLLKQASVKYDTVFIGVNWFLQINLLITMQILPVLNHANLKITVEAIFLSNCKNVVIGKFMVLHC
jgi:hypothetical protein